MYPSHDLFFLLLTILILVHAEGDVVVCGGFIKSSAKIPFSDVKVGVFTTDGILKESTECAPHNGYFLLPLYSKGRVSVSVIPPTGWTFKPDEIVLDIDGVTDSCSIGEDLNFVFQGFTVSGNVLSKGLEVGPTGISATLTDQDGGVQQHVKTVAGVFSIPNVLSGTYVISFSHPSWKMEEPSSVITVQMENYVIAEPFVVLTYDARGSVQSSGQPIAGVEVYLTPISGDTSQVVDGCEMVSSALGICRVISDTNGLYHFPALTPGKYQIVPHYQSEHSTFDVSPNQLVFNVVSDTVILDTAFTVNGFAVIGRVLDAAEGGSTLVGVHIFVNGEKVSVTNTDGMFELSNVTSGQYEVVAKLKGYYFETETRDISPNNPTLPDIVANAYQLCGAIQMSNPPSSALPLGQRKVGLQPSGEGSNTAMVTTVTDAGGAFCFKVSPGSYILQSLIGAAEYKDGLRLVPESIEVQITNSPLDGIEFHQSLGSLRGKVKCIIEDDCSSVVVHVTATDLVKHSVQTDKGAWSVRDLLPAEYKVTVDYPHWCWKETEQSVSVGEDSEAIPFIQSGYIMKVEVSHAALLNFSMSHLEEETPNEENMGTFSLEVGTNRFCLKKPGVYDLVPYTCHKFQQPTYKYDTTQSNELVLTAEEHLITGELHILKTEGAVQVILTNLDTHEKVTVETTVTDSVDDEGFTLLTYQMWSLPSQKYLVKPHSDDLLFSPSTHTTVVSDTVCPTVIPVFHGRQGTFVSGSITPPVRGVLITLTSPDNTELKLTQITDEHGVYSIGPLHNNLQYKVRAEKPGYNIHSSGEGHDFTALKLSKLTVTIAEGELPLGGVLVSVSGTKYRNNVVLDDTPLVLTGLVPGEYFIRPILKEYRFTPSSKMLTVSEGLEILVELQAERVAYSCYGFVTTLNGKAQPDVVVEAVGAGECSLLEEGTTGSDGEYRIRGLPPTCPITVSVRSDKSANVRRASPASRLVKGEGITDVNFIIFHEPTTFDITGSVDVSEEYISTTKVILVEEGGGNARVVHTSPLDDSRLFIFTEMDLKKTFTIKLESSLSPSMYSFKIPDVKVKSEGPFQHTDIAFYPIRKSLPQEQVTRASFTALAIIVLSMVLAANHATLVPVFTQVFHSVTNRNNVELQPHSSETNGMEYIDDIHRGIRRKSKKR